MARIIRPFQAVSTLSSSPGQMRWPLAVRIQRRVEAATPTCGGYPVGHLAEHILQHLAADASVVGVAGRLVRIEVDGSEKRIIVQHLLEVRHEPDIIDAVAMEAAAD